MVFILAASSLHHALEILTPEEKEQFNNKVYTIPGLSLNPNTKILEKSFKTCLQRILKRKKIVIWHDVLNNATRLLSETLKTKKTYSWCFLGITS